MGFPVLSGPTCFLARRLTDADLLRMASGSAVYETRPFRSGEALSPRVSRRQADDLVMH